MAKAAHLGVDGEQPSFKPTGLDSEKPRSNSISLEDLFEFAKKLGVPFIGDEVGVKRQLSEMLKGRDHHFRA